DRLQSKEPIRGGTGEGRRARRQSVVTNPGNAWLSFWTHRPQYRSAGVEHHLHDATGGALLPSARLGGEGFSGRCQGRADAGAGSRSHAERSTACSPTASTSARSATSSSLTRDSTSRS